MRALVHTPEELSSMFGLDIKEELFFRMKDFKEEIVKIGSCCELR